MSKTLGGERCFYSGEIVYHAERIEYDGKVFKSSNLNKWKKQQAEEEQRRKNQLIYEKVPDVSPSYYRTADPISGEPPRMVSGMDERDKK